MNQPNATIEAQLRENGTWLFQTVGDSMEPLLHNRESSVMISADLSALCLYDVVLYRRPNGAYVLHRVCRIHGDTLYIRGDNRLGLERVPKSWLLGRMTAYYPTAESTLIHCEDPVYQAYVRQLPAMHRTLWFKRLPERVKRKLRCLLKT